MSWHVVWIGALQIAINVFLNCFFWSIMVPLIANFSVTVQNLVSEYGMMHCIWAITLFTVFFPVFIFWSGALQCFSGSLAKGADKHRLDRVFKVVAAAAGVNPKKYKLYVVSDGNLNAFAYGWNVISVNKGALLTCHDDELAGILGHELGHIKKKHTPYLLFEVGINVFSKVIMFFFGGLIWLIGLLWIIPYVGIVMRLISYMLIVVYFAWNWLVQFPVHYLGMFASRRMEYEADAYPVSIGLGECMYRGLCKIGVEYIGMTRPTMGSDFWGWAKYKLEADHPDTDARIAKVEKLLEKWKKDHPKPEVMESEKEKKKVRGLGFDQMILRPTMAYSTIKMPVVTEAHSVPATEWYRYVEEGKQKERLLKIAEFIEEKYDGEEKAENKNLKPRYQFMHCPYCGGKLIQKIDKKGNTYYVCENSKYWYLGNASCDFRKYDN